MGRRRRGHIKNYSREKELRALIQQHYQDRRMNDRPDYVKWYDLLGQDERRKRRHQRQKVKGEEG